MLYILYYIYVIYTPYFYLRVYITKTYSNTNAEKKIFPNIEIRFCVRHFKRYIPTKLYLKPNTTLTNRWEALLEIYNISKFQPSSCTGSRDNPIKRIIYNKLYFINFSINIYYIKYISKNNIYYRFILNNDLDSFIFRLLQS